MKVYFVTIGLIFLLNFKVCVLEEYFPDADLDRNTTELIFTKGYPFEEYEVQTSDGYFITIQRIPYGIKNNNFSKCKREVVLLVHGMLTDSAMWVLNSPEQSLGFILSDHGHDVWMGNIRGNKYSTKHSKFTPDMEHFWDFSFAENGEYDVPAVIDFVLNKTNRTQIIVIALSQGATSTFVLLSQRPEYNKKIKVFIALAPVISLEHATSKLLKLSPLLRMWSGPLRLFGMYKMPPDDAFKQLILEGVCDFELKTLCKTVFFEVFGYDPNQLNETRLSVYLSHMLSGVSINALLHFKQMRDSRKFRKFDYGMVQNYLRYKQFTPPEYNISKVSAPVVLMWSKRDHYSDFRDIHALEKRLPNLLLSYCVPYENFSHIDFSIGVDADKIVYRKVLDVICKI